MVLIDRETEILFDVGHYYDNHDYKISRSRGSRDWLLIYTVSGHGKYGYNGRWLEAGAGELHIYRPGVPQAYGLVRRGEPWELIWAHFEPLAAWSALLELPEVFPGLHMLDLESSGVREAVEETLRGMVADFNSPGEHRVRLARNSLERVLLLCDSVNPNNEARVADPRIQKVLAGLHAKPDTAWTVDRLARLAGLSPSRFAHVFKDEVGSSVAVYLERVRMEQACSLLEMTNRPVCEVASAVGYEDALYFSRRFRQATGSSPTDWRKQRQG